MIIAPQTEIRLVKVPLSISNKNQITFANKEAQYNYFNSLPHLTMDGCTYQRKDNRIYFDGKFDDLIQYNYVMYQNEGFSNKWFYAFITDMSYVNTEVTSIEIATDVFQTWQFDIIYKESFIEREMLATSEDTPGANLLPETLETGEYKVGGTAEFDNLEPVWCLAYLGDTILGNAVGNGGYIANGMAQSVTFVICTTIEAYNTLMGSLNNDESSSYIMTTFSLPRLAVENFLNSDNELNGISNCYAFISGNVYNQPAITKTLVSTPNNLDGYVPHNQKLRTFPYMYVGFNPLNGSSKIYRYEDFANGTPEFKILSEVNPNPTICFIPQNYRGGSGDSLSDISTLNGYPTLSNRSDYFNTWLAQNSQIISLQMAQEDANYGINQTSTLINGMFNTGGQLYQATSNQEMITAEMVQGGLNAGRDFVQNQVNYDFYIKQQMAQIEKQQMLPDSANLSSSNATLLGYNLQDKNIFTRYTIKHEFAERIDKYFDMYGYLTNKVKLPNINNRPNWNYIKTIGINLLGDIPQSDLALLKNYFDNGITLWHNPATFLDYSQNNR